MSKQGPMTAIVQRACNELADELQRRPECDVEMAKDIYVAGHALRDMSKTLLGLIPPRSIVKRIRRAFT